MEMEPVEGERIFPMEDQEAELGEGNSILGVPPASQASVVPAAPRASLSGMDVVPHPHVSLLFLLLAPICPFPWGVWSGSLLVSHLREVYRKPQ